jgi:hypothetical protein
MNTTENNKLLAEFLGYKTYKMNGVLNVHYSEVNVRTIQDTHYHTDWNWLMQVVEKIESLGYCLIIGGRTTKNYCEIRGEADDFTTKYSDSYGETKIEAVYNACIEFVKWYNEQNK